MAGNWTWTAPVPSPPSVTSWPAGTVMGVLAVVAPVGAKLTWTGARPVVDQGAGQHAGLAGAVETISRLRTASELEGRLDAVAGLVRDDGLHR